MWAKSVLGVACLAVVGCSAPVIPLAGREAAPDPVLSRPTMAWDHRPEAEEWTTQTVHAVQTDGAALVSSVPSDVGDWCPGYAAAKPTERAHFWTGLLSALANYESGWRPEAAGGGGAWIGLMQISPRTAGAVGCDATTVTALKNGSDNLACAVRIMSATVGRDGVISAGGGGLAADWTPLRNGAQRQAMQAWTRSQSYCKG